MAFTLPELEFSYSQLEPHIDALTMEIHHSRHHNAYVTNANAALEGTSLANETCPAKVCSALGSLPVDKQTAVRNNAGGHFNHSLFWKVMGPDGGGSPTGALAAAIDSAFGSFDAFKATFAKAGATRFGSGWAWLCVHKGGTLEVCSTANQDNPLMKDFIGEAAGCGGHPILGLDVWEHAYYLKYQNKRPDYINAFWNVVDWSKVGERYDAAK